MIAPGRPSRSGTLHVCAWVAVLALAFGLRAIGLDRLLPEAPEPDPFLVHFVHDLRGEPVDEAPDYYLERYPSLVPRVVAHVPILRPSVATESATLESALALSAAPFVELRRWSMSCGIVLVLLTGLVARRFLGAWGALAAATLLATSLLHVVFSGQARPHSAHAALAWLTILAALRAVERPTIGRKLAASLASGFALASLQTGFFTLAPLCAAMFLDRGSRARRWSWVVLAPIVALLVWLPFNPHLPEISHGGLYLAGEGSHNFRLSQLGPDGFRRVVDALSGFDPVLSVLAAAGGLVAVATWIRRRARVDGPRMSAESNARLLVVLAYAVPFTLVVSFDSLVRERFLLPLLPCLAILAGAGLEGLVRRAKAVGAARTALVAVVLLVLAASTVPSARYAWLSTRPDTFQLAAHWLESNPEARTSRILAGPGLILPLRGTENALEHEKADIESRAAPWISTQVRFPHAGAEAARFDIVLFPWELVAEQGDLEARVRQTFDEIAPRFCVSCNLRWNAYLAQGPLLDQLVRERAELVHVARARRPGANDSSGSPPNPYQGMAWIAFRIFDLDAFGPDIEVWRVKD